MPSSTAQQFTIPHHSQAGVPTRLPDALGCRPSQAGGQGATVSTIPRARSRLNLRVLRPLNRGPQGQPSPLQNLCGVPAVQGIFLTSCRQVPHDWPMVAQSMATAFSIPGGCCMALAVPRFTLLISDCPHLPVPVRLIPSLAQSPSLYPVPHPMYIPHWAASHPLGRAD